MRPSLVQTNSANKVAMRPPLKAGDARLLLDVFFRFDDPPCHSQINLIIFFLASSQPSAGREVGGWWSEIYSCWCCPAVRGGSVEPGRARGGGVIQDLQFSSVLRKIRIQFSSINICAAYDTCKHYDS